MEIQLKLNIMILLFFYSTALPDKCVNQLAHHAKHRQTLKKCTPRLPSRQPWYPFINISNRGNPLSAYCMPVFPIQTQVPSTAQCHLTKLNHSLSVYNIQSQCSILLEPHREIIWMQLRDAKSGNSIELYCANFVQLKLQWISSGLQAQHTNHITGIRFRT